MKKHVLYQCSVPLFIVSPLTVSPSPAFRLTTLPWHSLPTISLLFSPALAPSFPKKTLLSKYLIKLLLLSFIAAIFRSTTPSRPNKVGLKRPYVRPSTKTFFDFNDIWCVGRCQRVTHYGMQYDPIQGQCQGHEPLKVGNWAIFKGYFLRHL